MYDVAANNSYRQFENKLLMLQIGWSFMYYFLDTLLSLPVILYQTVQLGTVSFF